MSREYALNLDQPKKFPENSKPVRVWLMLIYKFLRIIVDHDFFAEFIQTQMRYSASLDKISVQP